MTSTRWDATARQKRIPPRRRIDYRAPASAFIAHRGQVSFTPGTINPEWIIAGNPQARSAPLVAAPDGGSSTNFWDCTAGKFTWHYVWDETVLILEGTVRITDSSGASSILCPGDVAHFPAGSSYVWEVDKYVQKIAFHRRPIRSFWRRVANLVLRRIRSLFTPPVQATSGAP